MAKASLKLPDGTTVLVEGSVEEIQKIVSLYRPQTGAAPQNREKKHAQTSSQKLTGESHTDKLDISSIVNALKTSDEIELIEENILDRTSVVDRILLPLYIVHKFFEDKLPMTSGEISKTLSQMGITIFQSNVAKTLSSTASKYVIGDKVRVKGQAVRYRLSRRGVQYISAVIKGKADE